jgi:hypothetical protein
METLSMHNNELTTKLENIGSAPEAPKIDVPKIIKKDASIMIIAKWVSEYFGPKFRTHD